MGRIERLLATAVAALAMAPLGWAQTADVPLKKEPGAGDIPHGRVVYVDDGKCPPGEIKEVTGGSNERQIPRRVRCVKRPDVRK